MNFSDTLTESNIDFDADLDMQTIAFTADFHPWENGFRLSAGISSNSNEFNLIGTPSAGETVDINGQQYDSSQVGSLEGAIGFKSSAPYLGIGFGHAPKAGKGWAFDADLGVLFQGEPIASLTATCGSGDFAEGTDNCNTLKDNVAAEEVSFKEDAKDFDIYPVVSVGVSYRF